MSRNIELSTPIKRGNRLIYDWRKRYFEVGEQVTFYAARWPFLDFARCKTRIKGVSIVASGRVCYWVDLPPRLRCTLEDLLHPEDQAAGTVVIKGVNREVRRTNGVRGGRFGRGARASSKARQGRSEKRKKGRAS